MPVNYIHNVLTRFCTPRTHRIIEKQPHAAKYFGVSCICLATIWDENIYNNAPKINGGNLKMIFAPSTVYLKPRSHCIGPIFKIWYLIGAGAGAAWIILAEPYIILMKKIAVPVSDSSGNECTVW
jgi:hypothetical protein